MWVWEEVADVNWILMVHPSSFDFRGKASVLVKKKKKKSCQLEFMLKVPVHCIQDSFYLDGKRVKNSNESDGLIELERGNRLGAGE